MCMFLLCNLFCLKLEGTLEKKNRSRLKPDFALNESFSILGMRGRMAEDAKLPFSLLCLAHQSKQIAISGPTR